MNIKQLFLLGLSLALPISQLNAAHATRVNSAFNRAVNRFEILSQDYADQERDKSLNLPVVIRKEIDAFVNELGRKPKDKDIEALRNQLINKYSQPLATAITLQLNVRREKDAPTLGQLLAEQYKTDENLAQKFAETLINFYIQNNKLLASRLEQTPTDVQETIEHLAFHKNALLASLFDYKKIDARKLPMNVSQLSPTGDLIQTGDMIFQRQGDNYERLDEIPGMFRSSAISKDFSVIVMAIRESPELAIYVLNQETKKWALTQTILQKRTSNLLPGLSQNGSTIAIINGNTVHSYLRQGSNWVELKAVVIPEVKDDIKIEGFDHEASIMSPHGMTMVIQVQQEVRGVYAPEIRRQLSGYSKRIVYQRQKNGWTEVDLPAGSITFNTDDSLMLIAAPTQATVYARDHDNNWQKKQDFKGSARLLGNGGLIIINDKDLYVQKNGYHWQKQLELPTYQGAYGPEHNTIFIGSSDDCSIFIQGYSLGGTTRSEGTNIYTRRGNSWHLIKTIPTYLHTITSTGLALMGNFLYFFIPAAALAAADKLQVDQWLLINDLYEAQAEEGWIILNEEQRKLFSTLPDIFQKAILSKWRVATGTEHGVEMYRERKELKSEASRRAQPPCKTRRLE
jgi:hypothetical protein